MKRYWGSNALFKLGDHTNVTAARKYNSDIPVIKPKNSRGARTAQILVCSPVNCSVDAKL